jgi:hypothetical protein
MTNNAQLLPLPEDREEFEMFLIRHLGPSALAGDKISIHDAAELAFAKGIEHGRNALACIEAAKPADEGWKTKAAFGMYSHDGKIIDIAKPADALWSLPVVGYIEDGVFGYASYYTVEGIAPLPGSIPLTDHAQATAEIAKRDAEIVSLKYQLGGGELAAQELERQVDYLRAKLAGVDGLVEALRNLYNTVEFLVHPVTSNPIRAALDSTKHALATYEAAQGKTPPPEQA